MSKLLARIVLYKLSEYTVRRIRALPGYNNSVSVGDVCPMLVTRDWSDGLVNGTLFLDGEDLLWVTSVHEGTSPGQYSVNYNVGEVKLGA